MSGDEDLNFKIGIIGPARVGKTSLIASILKSAQVLLEGTPVSIRAEGQITERRVAQHHKELDGSLRAGEFNPGALRATEERFIYALKIDPGVADVGIRLDLLDYAGEWIDADRRRFEREDDWKVCKQWMKDSTVLIVPVESAIMMEASYGRHKKAVPSILNTFEIEQVARDWAKARAACPDEPGLLLFCPVKCESYFADNGGLRDSSSQLFNAFRDHYEGVLNAVRGEAPQVKILYAPVDTIGCVEIINATWSDEKAAPGGFAFSASYRVRPPGRPSIKGAEAVLVALFRHLVAAKQRLAEVEAGSRDGKARTSEEFAEKDEGFFGNFLLWASRGRKRRRETATAQRSEATAQRRIVESLDQIIVRLAAREFGPRVREM